MPRMAGLPRIGFRPPIDNPPMTELRQIFPDGPEGLLRYDIAHEVTAFSPLRDAVLPMRVVQAHQVHGDRVAVVTSAGTTREELEGYDAIVTDVPGVAIGARTADCIPVLMYDPVRRVVAAVHSGWKGTVLKIAAKTLAVMASKYGTRAADIIAVIGPGIGPDSFQVGPEVAEAFLAAGFPETWSRPSLPIKHSTDGSEKTGTATCSHSSTTQPHTGGNASFTQHSSGLVHNSPLKITGSTDSSPIDNHTIRLITDRGPRIPGSMSGGLHIDLPQAVRLTLLRAGVHNANILISGIDTYTHPGFFSARREGPSCGRTVNTIMLNP